MYCNFKIPIFCNFIMPIKQKFDPNHQYDYKSRNIGRCDGVDFTGLISEYLAICTNFSP